MQLFCLRYVWRNIQGYEMRTAIRDAVSYTHLEPGSGGPGFDVDVDDWDDVNVDIVL